MLSPNWVCYGDYDQQTISYVKYREKFVENVEKPIKTYRVCLGWGQRSAARSMRWQSVSESWFHINLAKLKYMPNVSRQSNAAMQR